jgi:light-regulated signal transduction histidine kinase (bacteriophytochrome)
MAENEKLRLYCKHLKESQKQNLNENLTKDGRIIICQWNNTPLFESDGSFVGFMAMVQDISDRIKAEEEIRKLNAELEARVKQRTAELEAANKELEAFSYSISHDLRSPLRAIDGFSRLLEENYGAQLLPEASEYLKIVREQTLRMGTLINDLLKFSQLNRKTLQKRLVSPNDVIELVLRDLPPELENRQIEMAIASLPPCYADPSLLQQVWFNLLSNAIKYTKYKPIARIEIDFLEQDGERVYFIKDNGAGFDMRYADRLFGVFQRFHRAKDFEGTGVGLALVQRIIHRHGGRIWAEAVKDLGATFYFTLPES